MEWRKIVHVSVEFLGFLTALSVGIGFEADYNSVGEDKDCQAAC